MIPTRVPAAAASGRARDARAGTRYLGSRFERHPDGSRGARRPDAPHDDEPWRAGGPPRPPAPGGARFLDQDRPRPGMKPVKAKDKRDQERSTVPVERPRRTPGVARPGFPEGA